MSDTPSDPQNDNPPPTDENSQTPSAGNLAGELTGLARAMKDLQLPAALVFAVVVGLIVIAPIMISGEFEGDRRFSSSDWCSSSSSPPCF